MLVGHFMLHSAAPLNINVALHSQSTLLGLVRLYFIPFRIPPISVLHHWDGWTFIPYVLLNLDCHFCIMFCTSHPFPCWRFSIWRAPAQSPLACLCLDWCFSIARSTEYPPPPPLQHCSAGMGLPSPGYTHFYP